MFIAAFALLALVSVVPAGGSLMRLADVRLAGGRYLGAAIALQILIISVFPDHLHGVHAPVHLLTYALAGAFMWANRRIAGLWLIAAGGVSNFAAIAVNHGVMPAAPSALRAAGLAPDKGEAFANSAAIARPKLGLLGDIFAVPESWPLSNVLSVGDLLVMAGLVVTLHVLSGSRLAPRGGARPFVELFGTPRFARVWAAQACSNVGDFVYSLAVSIGVVQTGGGVSLLATVLVVQTGPAIVAGLAGAPLVDRLSRRRLMVVADLARAAAVGSLVVAGTPSTAHILVVAACLGAFGAVFQPALQASLPSLVPPRLLMTGNATMTATYHLAVLAGPVIGATLAATYGTASAFAVDGLSFLLSAVLLAGVPIARPAAAAAGGEEEEEGMRAIAAGLRFAARSSVVRVIVLGCAGAMFAATLKQPLEPVFVLHDLGGAARDVGLAAGAWGLGMLFGSVAAPSLARRLRREQMMALGTAAMGTAIAGAAAAGNPGDLQWLWLLAGAGNAWLSVSYETLLLERTPEHLRGRVVAANEAGLDLALVVGLGIAGTLAGAVGNRGVFLLGGILLWLAAGGLVVGFRGRRRALVLGPLEHYDVGARTLVRVSGRWTGDDAPAAHPVRLRVTSAAGTAVEHLPLPEPAAASGAPWRVAFAPARGDLSGAALELVAGGHVIALQPAA